MASVALESVVAVFTKLLIEEYPVLGDAVRHVEWIEKELRSMHGWLEQVGQRGDGEQEERAAEKLMDLAREAEDAIETFVINSEKRRRWGVLHWMDKYKVGKELVHIRQKMTEISQNGMNLNTNVVGVIVETTPGGEASSSASISVVAPSVEKLEHILSQPIVIGGKVMEIVERVKGELMYLQNIVYNLKSTTEREKVWLEEVKEVCNYTESIAGKFFFVKERRSKMGMIEKFLRLPEDYMFEDIFQEKMKYVRTQIGDALRRSLTYGVGDVGAGGNKQTTPTSTPCLIPKLSLERSADIFSSYLALTSLFEEVFLLCGSLVKLWRSMDKILKCVQRDLDLMHAFLKDADAESAESMMNMRQKVWVSQLRLVAQNAKSLVDEYSKAGWFLRLIIKRDVFAREINYLFKEILSISDRKNIYSVANIIIQGTTQQEFLVTTSTTPSIQEEREVRGGFEPPTLVAASSYRSVTGLKGKVQSIRSEMELIDALFQDVQVMEGLDKRSRIWVDQMEGIAIEARSVINDYATNLGGKSFLTVLSKHQSRLLISNKIYDIRNTIEDASRRRKAYGLGQIQSRAMSSSSTVQILRGRMQPSLVVAATKKSSIIGFGDDAQVLIAQLLTDEKCRCITWIVGIGGTGKTTLAELIFHDNAVISHFECRISVSLPSNLNSNYTAQQLLEEIAKEATKIIKGDPRSDLVLETLAGKKYLIVVDGIEETSQAYLDTLKQAIPDKSTGSRLLLTTRNATIARRHAAGTITFVHPLQLLDDETSWVLFTKKLEVHIPEELMKVARESVMKCGGLPSQILKMSNLLSDKGITLTHEVWSSVLDQIQAEMQSWSETLKTINTNLPRYLKTCLSYFGQFPADFEIPVRRLVVLWLAESLVHHSEEDEVPPELDAERYLTELIDRNMVQVATRKGNGKVKTCRLPNALRQIWLTDSNNSRLVQGRRSATDSNADPQNSFIGRVAGSLNNWHDQIHGDTTSLDSSFLRTCNNYVLSFMSRLVQGRRSATDSNAHPQNFIIRRVADHLNNDDIWHDHIHGDTTSLDSSSLRTYYKYVLSFMSFDPREGSRPGEQIGSFLKRCISSDCFLLLRVLDLERVYKPELPKRIARLTQLRYLGLRWTYLMSLPSSISSLLKLQTLDLKHTYIHILPASIWKMELRHLFLSETYRTRFPPQPKGNFLSDLQTLWGLFVDEDTSVKGGLDKLVNIKKLGLACQSMSLDEEAMRKQLDAVADWITKLEHLQSLRLKSRDEEGKPWILLLKSFVNHTNLTDIHLLGSLSSSNVLSQFPVSLAELTLSHSKLEDDPMKLLKDLPNLRTLCLLAESYVGHTMVCESQSFPQLRVLKFWVLEHLKEWKIEKEALPCLRQLEIRSCSHLKMLPDGLEHVKTLLELITNMPGDVKADMHKILPNCEVHQN